MFQTDANYMLAESYFAQGDKAASLPYFDHVIDAPYGEWTEEALYKASSIYMENEEYQKAIGRFHLLAEKTEYDVYEKDALVGLMTAYNALDDFENTAKYAQIVEGNKLVENSNKFQARLLLETLYSNHISTTRPIRPIKELQANTKSDGSRGYISNGIHQVFEGRL